MIDIVAQSQSRRVFDAEAQYLAPGTQSVALFSKLCMDRGEGAILWDMDGNRYVDLLAGDRRGSRGTHWREARPVIEIDEHGLVGLGEGDVTAEDLESHGPRRGEHERLEPILRHVRLAIAR